MANRTEGTTRSETGKAKKTAGKKPAAKPAPKEKAEKKTQGPAKAAAPKKAASRNTATTSPGKQPPARNAGTDAPQKPKDQAAPFITSEQRHHLIAEAAYLRAERRGFSGGDATQDWLEAEKEVDAALTAGKNRQR